MKTLFPSPRLAPYVEGYYFSPYLSAEGFPAWFPANSASYLKLSLASAILSGQATKPMRADLAADGRAGLGVKLRIGALQALFGIPAGELTDRIVRLDEILGSVAAELVEQMAGAATPAAQVQHIERALAHCLQKRPSPDRALEQRAACLLRQRPDLPIAGLADELGYSSRQLQRKLEDAAGLSPRLLKRLCRFEQALDGIRASPSGTPLDWPALALACGYSDQAHFIRDFREFSGYTPAEYRASLPAD